MKTITLTESEIQDLIELLQVAASLTASESRQVISRKLEKKIRTQTR